MAWLPTVNVAKRAMMNASPRLPAVTTPSGLILAELSLLLRNKARCVTSRSVPSEDFARAGKALVIAVGVVAEQRQAEAVLAAGRAVARAGVAAGPHEDRHDVELEADGAVGLGFFNSDGDGDGGEVAVLDRERGGAVGGGI